MAVQPKIGAGHGQRCSPLAGAGLRSYPCKPLLLRIICLRDGRVELMAAARIVSLKFIVDLSRRIQLLFQTVRTHKRRRPVHLVEIQNFLRDIDIGIRVVQFLSRQLVTEHFPQLLESNRLQSAGVQQRCGLILHIGPDIVPLFRHLLLFQINFVRYRLL